MTLVDRTNHHLFQPLLYQVATAGLSAPEIAQPIRSILSDRPDVTVLAGQRRWTSISRSRQVFLREEHAGTTITSCSRWAVAPATSAIPNGSNLRPGLKTLDDALRIRSRVLLAFEKAENTADPAERDG